MNTAATTDTKMFVTIRSCREKGRSDSDIADMLSNAYQISQESAIQAIKDFDAAGTGQAQETPQQETMQTIETEVQNVSMPALVEKPTPEPAPVHDQDYEDYIISEMVSDAYDQLREQKSDADIKTFLQSRYPDFAEEADGSIRAAHKRYNDVQLAEDKAKRLEVENTLLKKGRGLPVSQEQIDRTAKAIEEQREQARPVIDTSLAASRPEFPQWVMQGTALWDCLVGPAVETSSKYAEFIFMPAFQLFLNYLSGKVTLSGQKPVLNLYVGLISPYGQFFKSSSCVLAQEFFSYMGIGAPLSKKVTAAEGKVVIGGAGSPEGFGVSMDKAGARNAILFNDELGKFVSKAGIESSSFTSDLLTWYEADVFENRTLNARNTFHFDARRYCFGWQWCTTDRGFNKHWPKLAGISSGMEDRMFFVVSPEKPRPTTPYRDPSFFNTGHIFKRLIDNAIQKVSWEFEDFKGYADKVSGMDPRSMAMVQKLALGFAILCGYDFIEDDAIERALALVKYRNQTAKFLAPIEAENPQARIQMEIERELRQNGGLMTYRKLCRNLHYDVIGADMWNRAVKTMLPSQFDDGRIWMWEEQLKPKTRKTKMVGVIKHDDD